MIFPPAVEQALLKQLGGLDVQPTLTYLANSIACGKLEVPYSTITAIDFQDKPPLGPLPFHRRLARCPSWATAKSP